MKPTIGRIVTYNLTIQDNIDIEASRRLGLINCNISACQLPAMIVAVWSETTVNLSVQLDGNQCIWKTSVIQGTEEGSWNWPIIEP